MTVSSPTAPELTTSSAFANPADAATVDRAAEALRTKGYHVQVADDFASAKAMVLALVPEGAEVGAGASKTLDEIGVTAEIEQSGRYTAIRPILRSMDRATQACEIRKLGAAPDVWLNSVHALTVDGTLAIASMGGSQPAPRVGSAPGDVQDPERRAQDPDHQRRSIPRPDETSS